MDESSELHIIIPGICGPLANTQSLGSSTDIRRWIQVLSKSQCYVSANSLWAVVKSVFNIPLQGDMPTAALTLLANNRYDHSLSYMHADPVHLQADMDHAVLSSAADLDISDADAEALCHSLNQHFNQDGLNFFRLNKNHWFVSSENKIDLQTTALADAIGRNVNFILPQGSDSSHWKHKLTEAQMLLHAHEINNHRENAGLPTINSLWLHGSGHLPEITNNQVASICSDRDVFKGLASLISCDYIARPDSVKEYQAYLLSRKKAVNVLHISSLEHLVNYTDTAVWLEGLKDVLNNWFYPVLTTANKNNIKVTLHACNGNKYQFSKYDALKFWRSGKLQQYIHCY